jgi:hypothetical protein
MMNTGSSNPTHNAHLFKKNQNLRNNISNTGTKQIKNEGLDFIKKGSERKYYSPHN